MKTWAELREQKFFWITKGCLLGFVVTLIVVGSGHKFLLSKVGGIGLDSELRMIIFLVSSVAGIAWGFLLGLLATKASPLDKLGATPCKLNKKSPR